MPATLNTNEIHVWTIVCPQYPPPLDISLSNLSDTEKARASRFKDPVNQSRWSYFHSCLRDILGTYTQLPPRELEFESSKQGKPSVADSGVEPTLYFNLSHSGNIALIAVSKTLPVGVDVEYKKNIREYESLVGRFFSSKELREFQTLDPKDRMAGFYYGWTAKEAIIKAIGLGLSAPLDAFDVPLSFVDQWYYPVFRSPLHYQDRISVIHLKTKSTYSSALAFELQTDGSGELPKVSLFEYNELG